MSARVIQLAQYSERVRHQRETARLRKLIAELEAQSARAAARIDAEVARIVAEAGMGR